MYIKIFLIQIKNSVYTREVKKFKSQFIFKNKSSSKYVSFTQKGKIELQNLNLKTFKEKIAP